MAPHFDVQERGAVGPEHSDCRARRLGVQQNALGDVPKQFIERPVFEKFCGQLTQRLEPGRISRLSRFLDLIDRDGDRRLRLRVGDGQNAIGVVFRAFEHDFGVAEADAIAALKGMFAIDPNAIEKCPVRASAVANDPAALGRDDLGMFARQVAIFDRNRAIGGPSDRHRLSIQLFMEWRCERRVDRDLSLRCRGCHGRDSGRKIVASRSNGVR